MDSSNCALCTDVSATTAYEGSGTLAALVVQETIADVFEPDVVIPLCEECDSQLTDIREEYRSARGPEEKDFAGDMLSDKARRLNAAIIEEASK